MHTKRKHFLFSSEQSLRKLRVRSGEYLHVTLPCKGQMAAPVFMTCWKSRERLATPAAETRDVQTAAHAHDDRTNLYGEITDKIIAVLKADRVCIEPHTDPNVPLGTVEVRQYLGKLPVPRAPLSLDAGLLARTTGPENRYSAVLLVEKEEFNALLAQAWIAERFDIAFISTKGMSTTAARLLLDRLAPRIDKVLVARDVDVSGFSIFGAPGTDGRRHRFHNDGHIVDLRLRLSDVEALRLDSEHVKISGDWSARAATCWLTVQA